MPGVEGMVAASEYALLAANLVDEDTGSSFIHRLTRPLSKRILEVAFNPEAGEKDKIEFTIGEIRPRFSSLAFNTGSVSAHVGGIPKMSP